MRIFRRTLQNYGITLSLHVDPQNLIPAAADVSKNVLSAQHIQGHCIPALIQPSESVHADKCCALRGIKGGYLLLVPLSYE